MSEFETNDEGQEAIKDTVEGTVKEEVVPAVESAPKRARKLPARRPIKVEPAQEPFPVPEAVFIPQFSIVEEKNVEIEVPEAVQASETTEAKPAEVAETPPREVKPRPVYSNKLINDLRRNDPDDKKTCASCAKRVPLQKISGGKAEICDDCK